MSPAEIRKKNARVHIEPPERSFEGAYTGDNISQRNRPVSSAKAQCGPFKNFVCVDPSYLRTLGQTHSDWIFGAVAEFVDNSRDAEATM